jgi:uncharacterized membrane protein
MFNQSVPSTSRNQIEVAVEIDRSCADIFAFYQDFRNLPKFLGDVMEVEILGPDRSRWTIEGPFGIRAHWNIEVAERVPNQLIRYRIADSDFATAAWELHFSEGSNSNQTIVRETLIAPLGKFERMAMALIGKFPEQDVLANLHRLKQLLETGKITDTSFAIKGKFSSDD